MATLLPHSPTSPVQLRARRRSSCLWLNYGIREQGRSRDIDLKVCISKEAQDKALKVNLIFST